MTVNEVCPVCQGTGKPRLSPMTPGGLTGLDHNPPGFDALAEALAYRLPDSIGAETAVDIAEDMADAYFAGFFHAFGEDT